VTQTGITAPPAASGGATRVQPPPRRPTGGRTRRRLNLPLVALCLPALAVYGLFVLLPLVGSLLLSLTDWNGYDNQIAFTGVENYTRLSGDPLFRQSVGTNLEFTLIVLVCQTLGALGLAVLLVRNTPATIFYRALYFLPTILSSVSVALTWILLYDPNLGLINGLLEAVGADGLTQSWLGDRNIAIRSLAVIQFWHHTGQVMIIFIAGLQAVPKELLEAAAVEGASNWQRFRHVTLPMLAPATTIVVAYTTIQSFRAFDLVISLTDGGPSNATEIMSTWIYHSAFRNFDYGYASAGAVIFLIVVGGLTALQFRLLRVDT
jgi:raffinose/stachyose/melibiose transport system permease protein